MSGMTKFECGALCIFADEMRASMKEKCRRCAGKAGVCLVRIISEVVAAHDEARPEAPFDDPGDTLH